MSSEGWGGGERTRELDEFAAALDNGKLDAVDHDLVDGGCSGVSRHSGGVAGGGEVGHEAVALSILLLAQVLETGLLNSLCASIGMLLVNVGVDQLEVSIVLGDPRGGCGGGWNGGRGRGRGSIIDEVTWGGAVED